MQQAALAATDFSWLSRGDRVLIKVVCNSGGPPEGRAVDTSEETWDQAIQMALTFFIRMGREAVPHLKNRSWGRIVNILASTVYQPIDNLVTSGVTRMGAVAFAKSLADEVGRDNILVNNVAVRPHKPILEITDAEWHNTLGINMHAAFYLCRAVLPGMMERKTGSIIALGGQSAITGRPGTSIVTTAKTGVLGLIRAVAAEMAPYNIRANMVNPGSTDTSRGNPEWYPEFQAGVERGSSEHLKEIPMGRQGTVQDIANACLFFASDESSYITGDSVNVMGGRYIF